MELADISFHKFHECMSKLTRQSYLRRSPSLSQFHGLNRWFELSSHWKIYLGDEDTRH